MYLGWPLPGVGKAKQHSGRVGRVGEEKKGPKLCNRLFMAFTKSFISFPSFCTKYQLLRIICKPVEQPLGAPW